MPPTSFMVFEIGLYVLTAMCLVHAWRSGLPRVLVIVAASLHGFVTENVAILRLHEYYYNRFLIMLCSDAGGWGVSVQCASTSKCVPLVVPLLESVLIYTAMCTSDRLGLPWQIRPLLDGLLAMTVDLALDPVVSIGARCVAGISSLVFYQGLGFWIWDVRPPEEALFGVNLNNFAGWFLGSAVFSLMLRCCHRWIQRRWPHALGMLGAAAAALVLTQLVLFVLVELYTWLVALLGGQQWIVFVALIGAAALVVLRNLPRRRPDHPIDLTVLAVPLFLMLFALFALLVTGLYSERPLLLALWLVLSIVAAAAYTLPYRRRPGARQSSGSAA